MAKENEGELGAQKKLVTTAAAAAAAAWIELFLPSFSPALLKLTQSSLSSKKGHPKKSAKRVKGLASIPGTTTSNSSSLSN